MHISCNLFRINVMKRTVFKFWHYNDDETVCDLNPKLVSITSFGHLLVLFDKLLAMKVFYEIGVIPL